MVESHTKIPLKLLTCYDKDKQKAWFFTTEGIFLHVYSAIDFSVVCTSFWLEAHTTYEVFDATCVQGEIFLTVTRMKKDDSSETLNLVVKASKIEDAPQIMHPNKELPMTNKTEETVNPLKGSLELTSDDVGTAASEERWNEDIQGTEAESEELPDASPEEDEDAISSDTSVKANIDTAVADVISTRLWHMSPTCVIDLSKVVAMWQVSPSTATSDAKYALLFDGASASVVFDAKDENVKGFVDLLSAWELSKESAVKENLLAHNPGWII